MNSYEILIKLFDKYEISEIERFEIYEIIKSIFLTDKFQEKFSKRFLHHGKTTLGEHILEDTIITYLLLCNDKGKNVDLEIALKVSMMHDMYTIPWQNASIKKDSFFHLHGFTHPIEAVINSLVYFKKEFKDDRTAKRLIDGIIHHMYPFPVACFNNIEENELELFNFKLLKKISRKHIDMIIESSNRCKIGKISICRSKYLEGRVMSRADKISTIKQLDGICDAKALVTGKNKKLID